MNQSPKKKKFIGILTDSIQYLVVVEMVKQVEWLKIHLSKISALHRFFDAAISYITGVVGPSGLYIIQQSFISHLSESIHGYLINLPENLSVYCINYKYIKRSNNMNVFQMYTADGSRSCNHGCKYVRLRKIIHINFTATTAPAARPEGRFMWLFIRAKDFIRMK